MSLLVDHAPFYTAKRKGRARKKTKKKLLHYIMHFINETITLRIHFIDFKLQKKKGMIKTGGGHRLCKNTAGPDVSLEQPFFLVERVALQCTGDERESEKREGDRTAVAKAQSVSRGWSKTPYIEFNSVRLNTQLQSEAASYPPR